MILVFFGTSSSLYKYLVIEMESISSRLHGTDPDEIKYNETKLKYSLDSRNVLHGIGTKISMQ